MTRFAYVFICICWISITVVPVSGQSFSPPERVYDLQALFTHTGEAAPLIVAHRGGAYAGYPENSIALFEHTLSHTPAIIEADFRLTQDDKIVMMHDDRLDRTTTGSGRVDDHTLEEIRQLRLVDHTGTATDHHPASLHEVLDWADGRTSLPWM